MEYGTINRELHIDARPEVVYEVISSADHLREWWPDDAGLDPVVGGAGWVTFGDPTSPDAKSEVLTVVEADPPRRFAFRWVYEGTSPSETNSLLVTFELSPDGDGTLLRFSESGFRERGWEAAVLEEAYRDHSRGWDEFLPRLAAYAHQLVGRP